MPCDTLGMPRAWREGANECQSAALAHRKARLNRANGLPVPCCLTLLPPRLPTWPRRRHSAAEQQQAQAMAAQQQQAAATAAAQKEAADAELAAKTKELALKEKVFTLQSLASCMCM